MISNSYELLDSGQGARLESFGGRLIIRPSSHAIWQRRNPAAWQAPYATYGQDGKWRGSNGPLASTSWELKGECFTMSLRLLDNGQVGIFPEHASYLSELVDECRSLKSKQSEFSLLNLFAYTGMCSVVAAKAGAAVTHVDISKNILDWATDNFNQNSLSSIRLIKEDAMGFMGKEVRRAKKYNFIVVDPPGFSRSKDFTWNIEDIIEELCELVVGLLDPQSGRAYVTFHGNEIHAETVRNLLLDKGNLDPDKIHVRSLYLKDKAGRRLPAGSLIKLTI